MISTLVAVWNGMGFFLVVFFYELLFMLENFQLQYWFSLSSS